MPSALRPCSAQVGGQTCVRRSPRSDPCTQAPDPGRCKSPSNYRSHPSQAGPVPESPVAGHARTPDRTLSAEPGGGNPHLSAGSTFRSSRRTTLATTAWRRRCSRRCLGNSDPDISAARCPQPSSRQASPGHRRQHHSEPSQRHSTIAASSMAVPGHRMSPHHSGRTGDADSRALACCSRYRASGHSKLPSCPARRPGSSRS
mmetsp:Transcript_52114/g.122377  ORF Transcript_52114/g.122377 Transcript_52114/m.122377 type:complete len:202 (+) Transcript_52114:125-730(+)